MTELSWAIAGMAAVTFGTRFGATLLFRQGLPDRLERWLRHVPTAVLTAFVAPALLAPRGVLEIGLGNHALLAGVVAGFAAWRSGKTGVTMAAGLLAMALFRGLEKL